jgi:hypothetical protein
MTTIEIDADLEEKLRAAAHARGTVLKNFAVAVLREATARSEDSESELSEEDWAAILDRVDRGLADFASPGEEDEA